MKTIILILLLLGVAVATTVVFYSNYKNKKYSETESVTSQITNVLEQPIIDTNQPAQKLADIETNVIEEVEPAVTNEFIQPKIDLKTNVISEIETTNVIAEINTNITQEISVETNISNVVSADTNEINAVDESFDTNETKNVDVVTENTNWEEPKINLEMTPESEYIAQAYLPTVKTVEVFSASMRGLKRGAINLVTFPGELARGFTYEYSAKKWYVAVGTSFLAALGGTGARAGAALADIATLGVFGDVEYAPGFPNYVWEGPWLYKPPIAVPTKDTSNLTKSPTEPDTDILSGTKVKVIKSRDKVEQEDIDFYEKKLPKSDF